MKFTCDRCGRTYSVSGDLARRSFRMKCKGCGNVLTVRGEAEGALASGDEPLRAAAGGYPVPVPPRSRDENPFETQPISIAAVRAALEAQERTKARQADPTSPGGLPERRAEEGEEYIDLVLDEDTPGEAGPPASQPPPTPLPFPRKPAGAEEPAEQRPALDPFADLRDALFPPPPPPEAAPVAEVRPAEPAPAQSRPPPAPAKRKGSKLALVLGSAGAVAVAVVLFLALGSKSKPVAQSPGPQPGRAAQVVPARTAPEPPPEAAPAEPPPAPEAATSAQEVAVPGEPEGDAPREKRRADERRSKERKARVARVEPRPEPPRKAEPPPAAPQRAKGPPSREQVVKIVKANWKAFQSCITEATRRDPGLDLAGRSVNLRMTVQPSGSAAYPTLDDAEMSKTDLGACLKSAARLMVFPRFQGDPFSVEVPLQLGK